MAFLFRIMFKDSEKRNRSDLPTISKWGMCISTNEKAGMDRNEVQYSI